MSVWDDGSQPPPCPFCNQDGVVEITALGERDSRSFKCQACQRTFVIHFIPINKPPKSMN